MRGRRAASRRRAFARLGGREAGPVLLRLPIPPGILRRVELGLEAGEAGRDAAPWWRQVELRMERFVSACLPIGARDVELSLDEEALEVVARFSLSDEEAGADDAAGARSGAPARARTRWRAGP